MSPFEASSFLEWNGIRVEAREAAGDDPEPPRAQLDMNGEPADRVTIRGVLNTEAMFRVVRAGPEFVISHPKTSIRELWLVETRGDGSAAVRLLHPFEEERAFVVRTAAHFAPEEFAPGSIEQLQRDLTEALHRDGLYTSEADDLFAALQAARLRTPGLRLLFFVTENRRYFDAPSLRLHVREPSGRRRTLEPLRVMLSAIELVTPEQRAMLARMAAGKEEQSVTGLRPAPETLS